MNVLIGCEYSAVVRDEFRKLGHNAWSCDLLPTEGDHEFHYQMDIFRCLKLGPSETRGLDRAKTYLGIAKALATQLSAA